MKRYYRDPLMTVTRIIDVSRVSRMTRMGRRSQFRALVVMGNGKGSAGLGVGKGKNGREALLDAKREAVREVVTLPMAPWGGTYYDVVGKHNNTRVMIRCARPRPGSVAIRPLTAGPVVKAVCDCFGVGAGATKVIGRRNPYTVVNATFTALGQSRSPQDIAYVTQMRVPDLAQKRLNPGLIPVIPPPRF